ncbi:complement factor H isoform 2-T3 [Menidia menidia]
MWVSVQPLDARGQRQLKSLLLIYLFVVSAAGDCPSPDVGESVVMSTESQLINDFTENVQVTLECAFGYRAESGSGTMTCIGDKWTDPDLICEKNDCGLPLPQPHMNYNISEGTLFGAKVKVTCDKGYMISGPSFKQCFAEGWFGRTKCLIVMCKQAPTVTNGKNLWSAPVNPTYGAVVEYRCDEGYTLTGSPTITCGENGEYSSYPPLCTGVTTEDRITTEVVTTTPESIQETSTSLDSSATPTVTVTTPGTTSPSNQGGRKSLTTDVEAAITSVTPTASSTFKDKRDETINANSSDGSAPVIISVVVVTLVTCIVVFFVRKLCRRRKGSSVNGTVPIC